MKKRGILQESLVLVGIGVCLFFLAFGIQRLVIPKAVGACDVSVSAEIVLKPLFRTRITAFENVVDSSGIRALSLKTLDVLLPRAKSIPYEVEILIIDAPVANACAFPGGLLVVNSGLIKMLEKPEEFAAVIAHELSHVIQRDSLSLLARQFGISAVSSMLASGQVETLTAAMAGTLMQARYSRRVETRADDSALDMLAEAGIDPLHFAHALERIRKKSDDKAQAILPYLGTHPALDGRILKAKERSERLMLQPSRLFSDVDWKRIIEELS